MGFFSFIKKKESGVAQKADVPALEVEYGKKQMRERADSLLNSVSPNALRYMSDGSGYLYVGMLVYICRADQKMTAAQRNIIIDFIRRHSRDENTPGEVIENQLRRWITASRRQFAVDANEIVAVGSIQILRDIHSSALRILATTKTISDTQQKAIEKLSEAVASFNE